MMNDSRQILMLRLGSLLWVLATGLIWAAPPVESLPSTPPKRSNLASVVPLERPLADIDVGIKPAGGNLPPNSATEWLAKSKKELMHYPAGDIVYFWDAPDLCYRPLYYEQINVERHGYSRYPMLQPAISGMHFFASTLALPYQMTVHPPRECIAPLGHYRPGNPVPYQRQRPEWNTKAAVIQTVVVGGLIFIIP